MRPGPGGGLTVQDASEGPAEKDQDKEPLVEISQRLTSLHPENGIDEKMCDVELDRCVFRC